jgi:frataxin-like iron-binding protein CyaY
MNGLDAHHDALLDRHLDQLDEEDDQSHLCDAERLELLDLVIQVQGALVLNQQDIAMCILNQLENHLQ